MKRWHLILAIAAVCTLIGIEIGVAKYKQHRIADNETAAGATVHTLYTVQMYYNMTYPDAGFAKDLETLGPPTSSSKCQSQTQGTRQHSCLLEYSSLTCAKPPCVIRGYAYNITPIFDGSSMPTDYVITAMPVDSSQGNRDFCSTTDAAIRVRPHQDKAISVIDCATLPEWEGPSADATQSSGRDEKRKAILLAVIAGVIVTLLVFLAVGFFVVRATVRLAKRKGKLKFLIASASFATIATGLTAWAVLPPYFNDYSFQGELEYIAQHPSEVDNSDDDIRDLVLQRAGQIGLPHMEPSQITITHPGCGIAIDVTYRVRSKGLWFNFKTTSHNRPDECNNAA